MKLRKLLLACGASLALAGIASAQSPAPPGNPALPPDRVAAMVRASGFNPLFRPMRQGDTYVLRALDRNDVEYRLVIDAYTGRPMSVRATGARGAPGYGPMYGRVFGPRDDRYEERYGYGPPPAPLPPRAAARPHPLQPYTQPSTQPGTTNPAMQAAAPAPGNAAPAPLPRPRPYVMEATSSIPADAPKSAEPQKTPSSPPAPQDPVPNAAPPAPAAPVVTPPSNMPPVTPLD